MDQEIKDQCLSSQCSRTTSPRGHSWNNSPSHIWRIRWRPHHESQGLHCGSPFPRVGSVPGQNDERTAEFLKSNQSIGEGTQSIQPTSRCLSKIRGDDEIGRCKLLKIVPEEARQRSTQNPTTLPNPSRENGLHHLQTTGSTEGRLPRKKTVQHGPAPEVSDPTKTRSSSHTS